MPDTLYRQWVMLRNIPRHPRKIATADLAQRLEAESCPIHQRTIQRDLVALSKVFPLVCDADDEDRSNRHKPYGWSWSSDAPSFDIPGMEPHTALTLDLAARFLKDKLPKSTLKALGPYLDRAAEVMAQLPGATLKAWPAKVRVIPRGQPFLAADIKPEVLSVVYDALLDERRFKAVYLKRGATRPGEYEVNPLGLVFRDGVVYLVATFWNYTDIMQLALHRMTRAELLAEKSRRPKGFDLDKVIAEGEFGFRLGKKPVALKLRLRNEAAITLSETPISGKQTLTPDGKEWQILKATVPDTLYLRNWILSLGDFCEVLAPASLRKEIAGTAKITASLY